MLERLLLNVDRPPTRAGTALFGLAMLFVCATGRAQWLFDMQAARIQDSNVTRAQKSSDIVHDGVLRLRGSASRVFDIGDYANLTTSAELALARYETFGGLSSDSLGLGAAYRAKLGTGLTVPWLEAGLAGSVEDARERVRDVARTKMHLAAGRRFSEALDGSIALAFESSRQRNDFPRVLFYSDKAFDLKARVVSLGVNYAADERWLIGMNAELRRGDVVSTTRRNPEIFRATNAIVADPAFGSDFIAYRLSGATTRSLAVTLSRALNASSSLDATLELDHTTTRAGLSYDGARIGVSYVYRR